MEGVTWGSLPASLPPSDATGKKQYKNVYQDS